MKKHALFTASFVIATTVLTASIPISPVLAADSTQQSTAAKASEMKPFSGAKLKTIYITSKSYIQIKDVYFLYGSKQKQVFFTLTVYNGDNTTIDFMDYWVELSSTAGSKYSIKSHEGNSKSGAVSPKTSKDFVFYAQVDPKLYYNNLIFKIVKWDFSLPNYTRTVGQAKISASYKNAVPTNAYYMNSSDNQKIKTYLSQGTIFTLGKQNQIHIDFNLENKGLFEYTLPGYQFYLRTKAGSVLKLQTDTEEGQSLSAGSSMKYSLRSTVSTNVDLKGAQVLVTALEGDSKIETPKGIYNVAWNQSNNLIVAENKQALINVNGTNLNSSIVNVYTDQSGSQNEVHLTLKWINKGKETVTLPAYKYEIMALNGVRYPVQLGEAEGDIQLIPGIEKEIVVQSTLPQSLTDGLTLLVMKPKDEKNKLEYVTAAFKLSKIQELKGVQSKTYKSSNGTYEIKLAKAERLPWGNEDIINIYVDIKNIGTKSQSIPDITSILRLNGLLVNNDKINIIKLDSTGIIETNQTSRYLLSTKVPYTFNLKEISLNLSDQINDKSKQTIGLFKLDKTSELPQLSSSSSYSIDTVGRRATAELVNTYTFKGIDKDLIYAEFKYSNKESRYSKLPVLKAFFKTSDGLYIDANVQNIKSSTKPDGTAMLTVQAEIPKTIVNDGTMQLIIGEALTGKEYTTAEGVADSFIFAKAFNLPKSQNEVMDGVFDLKLDPYTFSMIRLNTMLIDVSNVKLGIKYTLNKSAVYDLVEKESKLYFEITDGTNTYGSSVAIEPKEGTGLIVGEEKEIEVPITGSQLGNIVYNGYMINIYEEINGYKRLLGSKKYGSFQIIR